MPAGMFPARDGYSVRHIKGFSTMTLSANKMIHEPKPSENALKISEATLRSIFNTAPIGIGLVSNRVIKQVNEKLCYMLGYSQEALTEKNVGMLYPCQDEFERVEREKESQFRQKGTGTIETQWKQKDGDVIDVILSWAVINPEDASVETFTALDITDQKRAGEERRNLQRMLQQAQKMEAIGTLAGGIAHDFNNLLSPILIQTEIALMDLPSDSLIRLNLEDVLDAGNRARDLVRQILAFSRQGEEERIPIKVGSVVKDALKLLRATLPVTIEITQDITAASDMVLADSTQIHQILMNLCTNASQAMQEKGGVLQVGLHRVDLDASAAAVIPDLSPGAYLKLLVSDTGEGMDCNTLERIFDPYFTTKKNHGGTGMGLAVVHGIVKSYEGAITVNSHRGEGTTFGIYFPCLERRSPMEAARNEPFPRGCEKLLLVDDEKAIIDAIQQVLERLGYQVVARTSSTEALEVFRSQFDSFDIVITDQTMPGMTGEVLAKEMMAIRSDIPIVLCTGFSHVINEEKAKAIGIRKFIMKPVVIREMAGTIRRLLDETPV
jgi:PAS domain S-box-containing protein